MEVTDLQGYSGMVFVYDEDVANGFYMRNTPDAAVDRLGRRGRRRS